MLYMTLRAADKAESEKVVDPLLEKCYIFCFQGRKYEFQILRRLHFLKKNAPVSYHNYMRHVCIIVREK